MNLDICLDYFTLNQHNRAWAILKALNDGVGYNELAFYALTLQYHEHPNKKRWNIIYKLFLMPRDSAVESKIKAGQTHTLSPLQLKYFIDPAMALSPARQALKTKYRDEIFPELLQTFEKGDPAKGRKKVSALSKLGQKLTAYKRKVGSGDFDAVVAQVTRSGGPIDLFAQSISTYPTYNSIHSGGLARLRIAAYNSSHGATTSETKEHWLTNLQNTLPQYDLDPDAAGLGISMSDYMG
jgi:hypothetical protein